MSTSSEHLFNISSSKKEPQKLNFGIDRLLSTDTSKDHCIRESLYSSLQQNMVSANISKPLPTIAIPCSDCVTSLYRCCRVSPSGCSQDNLSGLLGSSTFMASTGIYSVQPIKPFATRASKYSWKRVRLWFMSVYGNLEKLYIIKKKINKIFSFLQSKILQNWSFAIKLSTNFIIFVAQKII